MLYEVVDVMNVCCGIIDGFVLDEVVTVTVASAVGVGMGIVAIAVAHAAAVPVAAVVGLGFGVDVHLRSCCFRDLVDFVDAVVHFDFIQVCFHRCSWC